MTPIAPSMLVAGMFRRVPRRLVQRLGAAGYAALTGPLLLAFLAELFEGPGEPGATLWTLVGLTLTFLVGPALLLLARVLAAPRARPGTLLVDGPRLELRVDGETHRFDAGDLVGGLLRPEPREGVVLHLRDDTAIEGSALVVSTLAGTATADDLVAALGLDARARAVTLRTTAALTPALRATLIYALLALALLVTAWSFPALRPMMLLPPGGVLAWLVARASQGPWVTVGVDGVRVRRSFGAQFVAWSEVARVEVSGIGCELWLTSGAYVDLGGAVGRDRPGALALAARIEAARAVATTAGAARTAATARQGRSVGEWRAAMGALLGGGSGYREGAVGADDLMGALRGGAASAEERVGAALALVAIDREAYATRVRVAAEATADGATRAALEGIAAGEADDAVLERATRGRGGR